MLARRFRSLPEEVYFVLCMGQSNMDGRTPSARLANTNYNYKGIAAGYPSVRTTQGQYTTTPSGVYTYFKTTYASDTQSLDNGSWQALVIGDNNCHSGASTVDFVGPELSLCTRLREATGKEIRLIKVGFSGTGLSSTCTTSAAPGNWNNTNRFIAIEYFVKRAMASFRAAYPTKRPVLVGVNWWQGENDAAEGISQATYEAQFALLKAYVKQELYGQFAIKREPIWNIVKLKFWQNAAETTINNALAAIVAADTNFRLIDTGPYPTTINLSSGEAAPIAVGTPNSLGWNDDSHASYIMELAVGELMADNILAQFP